MNIASRGATMAVDWEQRVNFDRLRGDRLARTKAALAASDLGALLLFDPNNLRYVTSTAIGTWERDKNIRFALVFRDGRPDPLGLRLGGPASPAVLPVAAGVELARVGAADARRDARRDRRPRRARRDDLRRARASAASTSEPLGMDVPDMTTLLALQRQGHRDRRLAAGDARGAEDQDARTSWRCSTRPPGSSTRPTRRSTGMLRPGVKENEIVAAAMKVLFELGSEHVEAINAISGDRCNPHPHTFSDRLLRPGDQAFFDIIHSFMGYRTCYYRTFSVGYATPAQLDAYKQCREWLDDAIDLRPAGRDDRQDRRGLADGAGDRDEGRARRVRAAVRARARRRPLRGRR